MDLKAKFPHLMATLPWKAHCLGPCTYDVRTEGGEGIEDLPNFADE